jgi:thiol-disulfide isomerase/thioredoxin
MLNFIKKNLFILLLIVPQFIINCRSSFQSNTNKFNSFNVIYKLKSLTKSDTIEIPYKIILDQNDSKLNFKIENLKNKNIQYKIDDTLYYLDILNKKFYKLNTKKVNPIIKIIERSQTIIKQTSSFDTIIKNSHTDSLTTVNKSKFLFNYKKQLMFASQKFVYRGLIQYEEYLFSGYKINNFSLIKDLEYNIKKQNLILVKKKVKYKKSNNIQNEININGITLLDKKFNSKEIKTNKKLILYDFWFKSCVPCILSIPDIKKIKAKYDKDLIIISINPIDKNINALKDFKNKYQINNKIVLIKKEIADSIGVVYFPTYILSDKKGKIIYHNNGYNNHIIKELDSVIKTNLK